MRHPSTLLAQALLAEIHDLPPDTVHPRFTSNLEHFALAAPDYFRAAVRDPSPLSDLRVRYDRSSGLMLELNLAAIDAARPGLNDRLRLAGSDTRDEVVAGVLGGVPDYQRDVPAHLAARDSEVSGAMYSYVNVFGGWDDAERIATEVAGLTERGSLPEGHNSFVLATAALVLALRGSDGYEPLFERVIQQWDDPVEVFFTGLRWASIEAKRRGDLAAAERVISLTEHQLHSRLAPVLDDASARVLEGMASNFRGLLALRNKNLDEAEKLSAFAVENLLDGLDPTTTFGNGEHARYAWMAQFNVVQLAWLRGERDGAIAELERVADFAREWDPDIVHTSLSSLAVMHLQNGSPAAALPYAEEAVDLVAHEYDPSLALQVRKVLLRCYLELGHESLATELRLASGAFWTDRTWKGATLHD